MFLDYASFLLRFICKTKFFVYSSRPDLLFEDKIKNSIGLIICNHHTRVDWMYAGWCYGTIMECNNKIRMILKESLRSVPIFGWSMQMMMYIFLSRKREEDIPHIFKTVEYLINTSAKPAVFIFPEGTDLSNSNIDKSNTFARENNLKELHQVLYPKSAGLVTCTSCLQGRNLALHDLTIAYKDRVAGKRTSESSFLKGEFPEEIHIVVDRHLIDELPQDRVLFHEWLRDSFYRKEDLLTKYYDSIKFVKNGYNGVNVLENIFPPRIRYEEPNCVPPLVLVMGCFVMAVVLLTMSTWFRWLLVFYSIACMGSRFGNGWDRIELTLHADMLARESASIEMN